MGEKIEKELCRQKGSDKQQKTIFTFNIWLSFQKFKAFIFLEKQDSKESASGEETSTQEFTLEPAI